MKTVKQALIDARALIDTPDKWCHGYGDSFGSMCIVHAIALATGEAESFGTDLYEECERLRRNVLRVLVPICGSVNSEGSSIGYRNDVADHATVLSWLDQAILKCDESVTGGLTALS